jgi:hypothetical protein
MAVLWQKLKFDFPFSPLENTLNISELKRTLHYHI